MLSSQRSAETNARNVVAWVLRAAELEARLRGVEAESQALKSEASESVKKQESLRREVVSWKVRP